MKKNKKLAVLLLTLIVLSTGCTKYLSDGDKKKIINEVTGQSLTSNILCLPEDEDLLWMEELEETENSFCYSVDSEVAGLNPVTNASEADNQAYNMICEPLVRNVCGPGDTSRMIPAAAKSWNVSRDGKTYTFHLRKNATWNDGVRLTAKDI